MEDRIYIRKKQRQSGKTTELLELAEILLDLSTTNRIIMVFSNERMVEYIRKQFRDSELFKHNSLYLGRIIIGSANNNIDFVRGFTFDYVLVDEFSLCNRQFFQSLAPYIAHNKAVIYATDTLENDKPIFNNNII